MNFLLDENLSPRLREVFNELGYDATAVRDRGRLGLSDRDVLTWAMEEDRIIVTANSPATKSCIPVSGFSQTSVSSPRPPSSPTRSPSLRRKGNRQPRS